MKPLALLLWLVSLPALAHRLPDAASKPPGIPSAVASWANKHGDGVAIYFGRHHRLRRWWVPAGSRDATLETNRVGKIVKVGAAKF